MKKNLDDVEMARLCEAFSFLVVDKVVAAPEILGSKEFLDKWHREVSCFIVSATPDSEILTIVKRRGLENYFIEVLGLSHSKKENLEYLFDKYSFEPGSCLF